MKLLISIVFAAVILCTPAAFSTAPNLLSYQGRLTNSAGSPLIGTYSVQFALFDVPTGGSWLWQETQSVTTDANGLFAASLGSVSTFSSYSFADSTRYLGIRVGADPELAPRTRLTSSPFAQRIASLDGATGGYINGYVKITGNGGYALDAYNNTPSGLNYAIYALADNATSLNIGVYGEAHDANGSSNSAGIYGRSVSEFGGTIWAGYFDGWTNVSGNFFAAAKFFKIDDPTDPANATFQHACVESNEYKNVYDGVVMLDALGNGVVTLPSWFETLNRDFRYQLTPIGAPGPNLYIAQEISGSQFSIAGGSANMKVSWMVTGVRKDPYALAHPVEVQKAKPAELRGKYLHPVEYGLDEKLGVDYAARQYAADRLKQAADRMPTAAGSATDKK